MGSESKRAASAIERSTGPSRRAFLRGAGGVAVALPFLASLWPRKARAEEGLFPKRFVVMFTPNGTVQKGWLPTGGETNFVLGPILEPLTPFREDLLILEGIDMTSAHYGPGDGHQTGMGHMLTARELLEGDLFEGGGGSGRVGWAGGISVDQQIANVVGATTKLKSLELGVQVHGATVWSRMSYLGPNQPVPPENDPMAVFKRLFADIGVSPAVLVKQQARRKSILDLVLGEYNEVLPKLDSFDRQKLNAHLDAIREVEKRLTVDFHGASAQCVVPPSPGMSGDFHMQPENFEAVGQAQMDLLVAALACDLTRVGSLQFSHSVSQMVFTNLGLSQAHHDLSHEPDSNEDAQQKLVTINAYYAKQMAYLLGKMKAVVEGDETLLDHACVVWVNELGKGNSHDRDDVPYVLAGKCGGYFDTGRYLRYTFTSHNDLLLTLCHAMGLEDMTSFGDERWSNGPLTNLT
ncbi:MAG: DUF1552 domain-containing protein [Myxococcota bacterium]